MTGEKQINTVPADRRRADIVLAGVALFEFFIPYYLLKTVQEQTGENMGEAIEWGMEVQIIPWSECFRFCCLYLLK